MTRAPAPADLPSRGSNLFHPRWALRHGALQARPGAHGLSPQPGGQLEQPGRQALPVGADVLWVLGTWLAGALVFYRAVWRSHFRDLMGNIGDTRFAVYMSEHWFQVLHGQASWLNPAFYYPVKGLLGWSDTFFLYQIFYAPLRLLGLDPFVALQVTVILLSLIGFASFFFLVRLAFGAPRIVGLTLGLAVVFSNALYVHAAEYQFDGVYFVLAVVLLGFLAWRGASSGHVVRSIVIGGCCGLLAGLVLYSTYYMAYFSLLAFLIFILVMLVGGGRRFVRWMIRMGRCSWPALVSLIAGFAVGLVPFVMTYLPARKNSPALDYAEVTQYAGPIKDLINLSTTNAIWGTAVRRLVPSGQAAGFEKSYAVTPILLGSALIGGLMCFWWYHRRRAARPAAARVAPALALTTLLVLLMPLRTRFGTPWAVVFHLPGAAALRAIDRVGVVGGLLAALTLAAVATEVSARVKMGRHVTVRVLGAGLLIMCVVEQYNTVNVASVNDPTESRFLASIHGPLPDCRSFYVVDSKYPGRQYFYYQIDAMLISQKVGLPTLNGYSAYPPRGWDFSDPSTPDYLEQVRSWASTHGVEPGLCQLDMSTGQWQLTPGR